MVLIHFKHGLLLRIISCDGFTGLSDLRTHMSSRVSSKCTPNFRSLQDEPILREILSDFSRVRGLSDLRTHMSSRVSSKCTSNFCYLHNEPYLDFYLELFYVTGSWTLGLADSHVFSGVIKMHTQLPQPPR
jgi:hypothetical protein